MKGMYPISAPVRRQSGAALVIGLILLLVLTLLAISGVNSASLEFFMAGNEQYRQNAFQAAETGIERAIVQAAFNPSVAAGETVTGTNVGTDAYSVQVVPRAGGLPVNTYGVDIDHFKAYHFLATSTGTAARNSTAVNTQGLMVITLADQTIRPGGGGLGNALN